MTATPAASWSLTNGYAHRAAAHFHALVDRRRPGLLPPDDAALLFPALGRLVAGLDDPYGRAALLTVLGHAHRRLALTAEAHTVIGDALSATVDRFTRPWSTRLSTPAWRHAHDQATAAVLDAADRATGTGPTAVRARVLARDLAAPTVGVLTVRPETPVPYLPGQALPVALPRLPGAWRFYSPANAPRPDGTIELHVRAVGTVSRALVHGLRPGARLWLGPATGTGLLLDEAADDLLLVAGGTGLAPLRALVEQVAAAGGGRRVTLVVGADTVDDVYDPVTLDDLQIAHDWLTLRAAVKHGAVEPGERGDAVTVALRLWRPGQLVYLCGPPRMIRVALLRLDAAGVPASAVRVCDPARE